MVITTLVLIRHGNTYDPGDVILRGGRRTDLPLSSSGREQAEKLGPHFAARGLKPDAVYVSPLRRTQETAALALPAFADQLQIHPTLNELDHGPDEGKPETEVVARLGENTLHAWETRNIMPAAWSPRPEDIARDVATFKDMIVRDYAGKTVCAVTSNGIARFFADAACVWDGERPSSLKLGTARYAVLEHREDARWHVVGWNINAAS